VDVFDSDLHSAQWLRANQLPVFATRWQLVPSYVCNFYFGKTQKIAKNFTTTKAREKISTDLESLEFKKNFDACLTNFKNYHILLNKITQSFQLTTNLFIG
jgi:hypothetical protein